jgi:hypothetical protein
MMKQQNTSVLVDGFVAVFRKVNLGWESRWDFLS